jgi:hypothetical protein
VALLPITLLADLARRFSLVPAEVREGLTVACGALYTIAVAYALVAAGMRAAGGPHSPARPLRQRLSRLLRLAMFTSFGLSGIWRFAPDPFGQISAWAWAVFGVCLVANVLALAVGAAVTGWRKRPLALRKVPSQVSPQEFRRTGEARCPSTPCQPLPVYCRPDGSPVSSCPCSSTSHGRARTALRSRSRRHHGNDGCVGLLAGKPSIRHHLTGARRALERDVQRVCRRHVHRRGTARDGMSP